MTVSFQGRKRKILMKRAITMKQKTDEWGVTWEYKIFGLQGTATGFPFESWDHCDDYSFPEINIQLNPDEDLNRFKGGSIDFFQKLYALRPMDDTFIELILKNPHIMNFLEKLIEYRMAQIDRMIVCGFDMITIIDDLASQQGPLVSPDFLREHFFPRYKKIVDKVHSAGKKLMFHCCGNITALMDDFCALNIDGIWAQLSIHGNDENFFKKCRENNIAVLLHLDRQHLIPHGTPKEIEATIAGYTERFRNGGGIFYVEIENDAPWENAKTLIESIERHR